MAGLLLLSGVEVKELVKIAKIVLKTIFNIL